VSSLLPEKGRGGAIFGSLTLCDAVPVLGLVGPGPKQAGTGVEDGNGDGGRGT
jgi:hypothetical protein